MNKQTIALDKIRVRLQNLEYGINSIIDGIESDSISCVEENYRRLVALLDNDEVYSFEKFIVGQVRTIVDNYFAMCLIDNEEEN